MGGSGFSLGPCVNGEDTGQAFSPGCDDRGGRALLARSARIGIDREVRVKTVSADKRLYQMVKEFTEEKRVEVRTKYKTVDQKIRPSAVALPADARERLEKARSEPRLRDPKGIGCELPGSEILKQMDIGAGLNEAELSKLTEILGRNARAFSTGFHDLGCVDPKVVTPMVIFTVPHKAWKHRPLPIPRAMLPNLIPFLKDRIESKIFIPGGMGPYSNRWFCVVKKSGAYRAIEDCQPVNRVSIMNVASPPNLEEYVASFAGRVLYSSFDLTSGFDQFQLALESRPITAIATPLGLLEMGTLPQGFCNSPAHMQEGMNKAFAPLIPHITAPYMDDLPVKGDVAPADWSITPSGCRAVVEKKMLEDDMVMTRAREVGLTFGIPKTGLLKREIEVVGFLCNENGRRPTEKHIDAIQKLDENLRSTSEARRFMGTVIMFRAHIPHFATIAEPIYRMFRKGAKWRMTEEVRDAIKKIKGWLREAPTVGEIDYSKPVIVKVDSSPVGVGWVIWQENRESFSREGQGYRDGDFAAADLEGELAEGLWPIKFGARTLTPTQRDYPQVKRELFGVYTMLRNEQIRLRFSDLEIHTDCAPLRGMIYNGQTLEAVTTRWVSYINSFAPVIIVISGKENKWADMLSRARYCDEKEMEASDGDDDSEDSESATDSDGRALLARSAQENERPARMALIERVWMARDSVCPSHEKDQGLVDVRAAVETVEREMAEEEGVAEEDLDSAPGEFQEDKYSDTVDMIRVGKHLEGSLDTMALTKAEYKRVRRMAERFVLTDSGLLMKKGYRSGRYRLYRVLGTKEDKREALVSAHEDPFAGHRGLTVTFNRVAMNYYWDGYFRDTKRFVESCETCQMYSRLRYEEDLHPQWPISLHYRWSFDVVSMPKGHGYQYLGLAIEDLSGWHEGWAFRTKGAREIYQMFTRDIFCRYGTVISVTADGGELNTREFKKLCEDRGIRLHITTSYNPQANGRSERGHQPIVGALAKICDRPMDWPKMLSYALWADRTTHSRIHGRMPYELMFGAEPMLAVMHNVPAWGVIPWESNMSREDLLAARVRQLERRQEDINAAAEMIREARTRDAEARNLGRRRRPEPINVGDWVVLADSARDMTYTSDKKLEPRWSGPYEVTEKDTDTSTYRIAELDGTVAEKRVAGRRLKMFKRREEDQVDLSRLHPEVLSV